jgi:short-subunit dehydrogenase
MTVKLKPLSQQVIVITGASSGIGLATAKMAAQAGASVVLAARTADALATAAQEIEGKGGQALAVQADVGLREDVERVAEAAVARFGRIDTWVNNAGVGIWGLIDEVSLHDMRRLFDTNFWGMVHGSLAALPRLREGGGALINVGSMASDRAIPLQGIYSASKHAVKGFTDAFRSEIEDRGTPISVTLIKPASIGTPLPQHVKNYTDREAKLPPPIYAPEDVARVILRAATHPTRDAFVGSAARAISMMSRVAPRAVDLVGAKVGIEAQLGPKAATPTDNLWEGRAEGEVRGDTQGSMIRPSLTARARSRPVLATAAAGAALAGAAYLLSRRNEARAANGALVLEDAGEAVLDLPASGITIASGEDDLMGSEAMTTDTMGDGTLDDGAPGDEPMDDGALDAGAAAEDGGISNGLNARPLDDTISQSAPGIPDDSGRPVEIAPEEEARLAERIRSM